MSSRRHVHRACYSQFSWKFLTRLSSTHGGLKSKTYVITKKGKIYLRHNSIHEDVPIAIALKALGRPTADRGHANESVGDGGRKRSCARIQTIARTSEAPKARGVLGILTTGASIAGRTPSTASATRLSSELGGTPNETSMLQRWTRQSLLVP